MVASLTDWLEVHADREFQHQKSTVENCKLIGTFIAAIAATLVATALQVGEPTAVDFGASVGLAFAVFATWRIIRADRLKVPDVDSVMSKSLSKNWTQARTLEALQDELLKAVRSNKVILDEVKSVLIWTVVLASIASVLAISSLLAPLFER